MENFNGLPVRRYFSKSSKTGTIFIPLPREAWREIEGGCSCAYCSADAKSSGPAYWDTLAVAAKPGKGKDDRTWTVHYPELSGARPKARVC